LNCSNVTSFERDFSTKPYLATTSDIVALVVLKHQCSMHNKLTDAGKSTREAMALQHNLQKAGRRPVTNTPDEAALTVINAQAEKVVRHLLFCEEYALADGIEALPTLVKKGIYERLLDVLTGKDTDKDFEHLSESECENIREILRETKKDLPDY